MGLNSLVCLGSAQIRERCLSLRDRGTALVKSTESDVNIQLSLKVLNDILMDHLTCKSRPIPIELNKAIHDIYSVLTVDESMVYELIKYGSLPLCYNLDVEELTEPCTMDLLGIHDKVLSALMAHSDEDSDVFKDILERSTKFIQVFLLSFLDYNELSDDLASELVEIVFKLCRFYSVHPSLVDHWFNVSVKEPDVSYTLYNKKLTTNCFPVYEITRIFLLLEDQNADVAKECLQLLVSTSRTSVYLEDWVVGSDLLDSILAGLLLNFNRVFSGGFHKDETLLINEPSGKFDAFLTFVVKMLRSSKSNSLRILLMKSLNTKFLSPLIEMFSLKDINYSNVLQILTFTLEMIIIFNGEYPTPQHESVLESFSGQYLDAKHHHSTYILDLFTHALRDDYFDDPSIVICLLNMIGIFACSQSTLILEATIFDVTEDLSFFNSPMVLASWTSRIIRVQKDQPGLKDEAFETLKQKMINMRHNQLTPNTANTRALTFKSEGPIRVLLCLQLSSFFTNTLEINDALINVLSSMCQANRGLVTGLFMAETNDKEALDLMVLIWDYLWVCYDSYTEQIQRDKAVTRMVPMSEPLHELLKRLINSEYHSQQKITSNIRHENLKRFRYIVNELFVVSQTSLILNNISFPNIGP